MKLQKIRTYDIAEYVLATRLVIIAIVDLKVLAIYN